MHQKNKSTGFTRAIRMSVYSSHDEDESQLEDKKNAWHLWQWLDETNKWINYPAFVTFHLEKAYNIYKLDNNNNNNINNTASNSHSNNSNNRVNHFKFKLTGRQVSGKKSPPIYTINFKKMTQENDSTGFSRKIRRFANGMYKKSNMIRFQFV
jgi:hypothetical protein